MLRFIFSMLRRRVEGACALVLMALLLPCWWWRRFRRPGDAAVRRDFRRARARWAHYLRFGLSTWRTTWWPLYQIDGWPVLARGVWSLEWGALQSARPVTSAAPETVVYTPGHIGDLLHVLPMLDALRRQQPAVEVTWVVGPWVADLASRAQPGVRVLAFAPPLPQFQRGRGKGLPPCALMDALPRRVDQLLTTSATDPVTVWLAACCRPRVWAGMSPEPPGAVLADRQVFLPYERDRYEAEAVMALLPLIGLSAESVRLRFPLTEDDEQAARAALETAGLAQGVRYVAMAPGSGWPGKNWPAERFGLVATAMHARHGLRTVVLGSPDEAALGDVVARASRDSAVNLVGRTTLLQSAAIVAGAVAYIGNDSGLLHVAAACDVPAVGLFGPTRPGRWAPRGNRQVALRAVEQCEGCQPWHPRAPCLHAGACMQKIALAEVEAAVQRVLEP